MEWALLEWHGAQDPIAARALFQSGASVPIFFQVCAPFASKGVTKFPTVSGIPDSLLKAAKVQTCPPSPNAHFPVNKGLLP